MSSGSPSRLNTLWKGKAAAIEEDFDDLHPVITYRHLAAQNLGVKDPFRVVALCDTDAFYAACEMVRLGIDKNRPLVVLQWEALIAVNYPARKFGISRMDKLKDAKRRCPELVVVHVATYKEGEKEPGYWDNVDSRTHKVRCRMISNLFGQKDVLLFLFCVLYLQLTLLPGVSRLLSPREYENFWHVQTWFTGVRNR
jgi:DNA polymerase eta